VFGQHPAIIAEATPRYPQNYLCQTSFHSNKTEGNHDLKQIDAAYKAMNGAN
jgi:hypothetical protein